jgi:hypothetical protein
MGISRATGPARALPMGSRLRGRLARRGASRRAVASRRPARVVLATMLTGAAVAAGCGGGARTVARVGSVTISRSTLDYWATRLPPKPEASVANEAPACVHALQSALEDAADRREAGAGLGSLRCVADATTGARSTVALERLLATAWLAKAAAGLVPSGSGAGRSDSVQSVPALSQDGDAASLAATGRRLLARVIAGLEAQSKLAAHRQIAAYYQVNIARFVAQESRDAEVVRTRTLGAGDRARAEIEAGVPFESVVRRFTVDALGKTNGGLVLAIVPSQEDSVLKKAVFSAKLHELTGPVMLEPGRYYLFRIRKATPARRTTLASFEASALARYRRAAFARIGGEWLKRLTAETGCKKGYVVEGCRQFVAP